MSSPPDTFTRYCGDYVIDDLEQLRLSVAKIGSFNDPFELHLSAKRRLTRTAARSLLRKRMQDNDFWARAAAQRPALTGKELKRSFRQTRGQMISRSVE